MSKTVKMRIEDAVLFESEYEKLNPVDERKAKWIAIATKWSKEHPDMMHKGIVCQKCGKPAYAVDLVTGTALCIECEADAIFDTESNPIPKEDSRKIIKAMVDTFPELDLQTPPEQIDKAPESAMQEKPPFITEEMEVVCETAPKPDPTFEPPGIKLKSGFYAKSEPITIRRMDNACGISIAPPRKLNTDIPFERDLFKLVFLWNYRDNGYPEEEIQEIWKKTPWGSKDEIQAKNP